MNTTESNILIAKFMGMEITKDKVNIPLIYQNDESPFNLLKWIDDFREIGNLPPNSLNRLHFHKDWIWLMQVVEKIENITDENNFALYDFTIYTDAVRVSNQEDETLLLINKNEGEFTTKIEAVYLAVVQFIEWYNLKTN